MSRDRQFSKLELVIEKEKPKEKLKADNGVTLVLPKIPTILDDDKYEKKKEIKKQEDDEIKDKIDLQMLTDEINWETFCLRLNSTLEVQTQTISRHVQTLV